VNFLDEGGFLSVIIRVGHDLAETRQVRGSPSLGEPLSGVEDTRRPARVSTFWEESAPSLQKFPEIPKSEFFVAELTDRPIF
jgi:hypothetical protein